MERRLGVGPAIELAGEQHAEHLIAGEARPAGAGIPGAGGEEVLLNERGEARLCIEELADRREFARVLVADSRRGEGELLDVAHSAVSPRDMVGVSTTPTYRTAARTPSPNAVLISTSSTPRMAFQDGQLGTLQPI